MDVGNDPRNDIRLPRVVYIETAKKFLKVFLIVVGTGLPLLWLVNFVRTHDPSWRKNDPHLLVPYTPPDDAVVRDVIEIDDSTYQVDVPLTDLCCKVDKKIPSGRWIKFSHIEPMEAHIPPVMYSDGKTVTPTVMRYGACVWDGSSYWAYVLVKDLKENFGAFDPDGPLACPYPVLDNVAAKNAQEFAYRCQERQYLHIALNWPDTPLRLQARGFYRIQFMICH